MEDTILAKEEKKKKSESGQNQDPAAVMSEMNNDEDETFKTRDLSNNKNEELELAKAEMGQVAEENKRLKSNLDRMMKDYQTLQMHFYQITQQGSKAPVVDVDVTPQSEDDTHELSLSLGRNSSIDSKNKDETNKNNFPELSPQETLVKQNSGLSLALDYKNQGGSKTSVEPTGTKQNSSTENSFDEPKDDVAETWPPSKALKTVRSGGGSRDDEVVQQPPVKKARVSVRARCDTPTMNDGCQWRKYGQKIAKGNPCPRAYYRCTVAPNCPVRKQVQRCADDMSILITTYEGTHNHPLPISATAMASTTSAAAYMLVSGSSTSNSGIGSNSNASNTNTTTNFPSNYVSNFPGLNFNLSDTSRSRPFFLPNSSFLPSPSQPTITLDLTTSSSSSSSASQFSKLASTNYTPRPYPNTTTNLTFNSLELSNPNPNSNPLPFSWPPNGHQTYNKDGFYQTLFQKINPNPNPNVVSTPNPSNKPPPPPLDPVAAAAKAITSDPSFQSVLTAALSSLIGVNNNVNVGVNTGNQSSSTSSLLQATTDGGAKGNGCASSVIGIAPNNTTNAQTRNLMLLSSPLPFSNSSKSTSSSPGASREHHS